MIRIKMVKIYFNKEFFVKRYRHFKFRDVLDFYLICPNLSSFLDFLGIF